MSPRFRIPLARDADLLVEFETERGEVTEYSVVLRALERGSMHAVRVWDNRHGVNEMHRYTRRGGKQAGMIFHSGGFGEAMRSARSEAERNYREIIGAWRRS